MAIESENISLKPKFKDNTSNLYTKQDLKNDKLSKIKESLQKSKGVLRQISKMINV